jgi:hypothetical protein
MLGIPVVANPEQFQKGCTIYAGRFPDYPLRPEPRSMWRRTMRGAGSRGPAVFDGPVGNTDSSLKMGDGREARRKH